MKEILKPRILDLFAGAGGFSFGMHSAGFHSVAAIDHNNLAVETLKANFEAFGTLALERDLAKLKPRELAHDLEAQGLEAEFDVIIGGPPCQGWSSAGRGKIRSLRDPNSELRWINDPRNKLYRNFLGFVGHFNPKVCIMENVAGMLSHNGKNVAESIANQFHQIGYCVTWALVNAADFGVPQSRKRLIFVGVRNDLGIRFKFPQTKGSKGSACSRVTLREAIGDLPIIRNGSCEWQRVYRSGGRLTPYVKLMRHKADPNTIYDHVCRSQNEQDLEAFRILRPGGKYVDLPKRLKRYRDDIFKDKYRKLRWNEISGCVTAHLSKDCYTHIHPSQVRTISVREAARIQSFPDRFHFAGSMGDKFRLIGNAVPPLMAQVIGKAVKAQVFSASRRKKIGNQSIYDGPQFVNLSIQERIAA